MTQTYPKVKAVTPLEDLCLLVTFQNEIKKLYDCSPLLDSKGFQQLSNRTLFQRVKTDQGGYGVSWNDDLDLSESELWINGQLVEQSIFCYPN
ncbi:DUF2442 domain-containing protein [Deltaproteobacteria bacterium TL4]